MTTNGAELKKRHIGELVHTLTDDARTLVRQEIALAKAELRERLELVEQELDRRRELIKTDLAHDASSARDELTKSGKEAAAGAGMLAGAGVVGLVVLGLLAALVVRLLDYAMPLAAALAVTLVLFAAVAAALVLIGRGRLRRATPVVRPTTVDAIRQDLLRVVNPGRLKEAVAPPKHTVETVKEDVEWAKTRTPSART